MKELSSLINRFASLADSSRNSRLAAVRPRVSFHVGLGRSVWKNLLAFDLLDYFDNPAVALESQMRWKLFWHDRIPDDTRIEPVIGIDFGVGLEPSLFGVPPVFSGETDPMYGQPVIREHSDLLRLKIPDFHSSGLMPKVHRFYEEISRLTGGAVPVRFTGWARGPWSVACMLRGFNELYLDLADQPGFVRDLLDFIVASRIEWEKQRCRFLGIDVRDTAYEWQYVVYRRVANSELFNDEVDGALFSPEIYREFVFPAEKRLHDFYGGTRYYHSCGNMTPFLGLVRELAPELMHISQATDAAAADRIMDAATRFQCCMHPIDEVLRAGPDEMRAAIAARLAAVPGRPMEIWADAIYQGGADTLDKALTWLETARALTA